MGVKRWWKTVGLSLVSVLTGVLILAPPALAHEFINTGDFGLFAPESPRSAAVDAATGDVYVLNNGAGLVEEFGPNGEPGESFGGAFSGGVAGLAVDNSTSVYKGDMYVADREGGAEQKGVVDKFAAGKEIAQFTGVTEPNGVAVDSNGDVYVSSEHEIAVLILSPEGNALGEIAGPDMTRPFGVAVSPGGEVYVINNKANVVEVKLNTKHEVQSETIIDAGEEPTAVAVEPSTGDIFVVNNKGEPRVDVFDSSGKQEAEFGAGQIGLARGIAFSPSNGDVYVADKPNQRVDIFEGAVPPPPPPLPAPVTDAVSVPVERTSVTLSGTVNPEGEEAKFYFEYGPCASSGVCASSAFPSRTAEGVVGAAKETTPVVVEEHLVNELTPGTTYHARLAASNPGGSAVGEEVVFTTPPAVNGVSPCAGHETGAEASVGASLQGSLEPEGEEAEYYFEYGQMSLVGPPTESVRTNSSGIQQAHAEVTGLEPNATYECRLTAARKIGGALYATHGESGTFTTRPVAPTVEDQPPSASAITRKTAVLKATINPEHSATAYRFIYVAAADYERSAKNPYYAGESTPVATAGAGFGDESISATINGLRAGTTYDYAVEAEGEATKPTVVIGHNHQFTTSSPTPPVVLAGETVAVTPTSAVISVAIDPEGLPTTYAVDFGAGLADGGATIFGRVVEGHEVITLSLENLTPDTTYVYTALATNEDGTSASPLDRAFTTPSVESSSPSIVQPPTVLLVATPPIAFPTELGEVIKPPAKRKPAKPKKKPSRSKKHHYAKSRGKHRLKGAAGAGA